MSPTIIDPYHNESYYETHSVVVQGYGAQQETSHKSYVKSWHLREDLAPGQVLT